MTQQFIAVASFLVVAVVFIGVMAQRQENRVAKQDAADKAKLAEEEKGLHGDTDPQSVAIILGGGTVTTEHE